MAECGPVYTWGEQGARESVKPLTQGAKALRGTAAPPDGLAGSVPKDSDVQRGSAQSPHSVEWDGRVPRWHAAGLGFAASGVSRACACVPPQPGGAGGGPIRAPRQSLPLPLVTAASLLCLAWVQPPHTSPLPGGHPALPSQSPRAT